MVPFEPASLSTTGCMSLTETADAFLEEPTNVVIAAASPVVPALACIMVPPIIPPLIPPMPVIEIGVEPIIPFSTPSEASLAMAVKIPDEETVIPMVRAYCDIAATLIP